jgi:antitoxin ParD1/3/4
METMKIALPDDMMEFVNTEIKTGGYSSASDFVMDLIRSRQEKRQQFDSLLLEAIMSDRSPLRKKDFVYLRSEFAYRASKKK